MSDFSEAKKKIAELVERFKLNPPTRKPQRISTGMFEYR